MFNFTHVNSNNCKGNLTFITGPACCSVEKAMRFFGGVWRRHLGFHGVGRAEREVVSQVWGMALCHDRVATVVGEQVSFERPS